MTIDLNCDAGESREAILDGSEDGLFAHVTSVNVACGGHAGDQWTMQRTLGAAAQRGLAVGAHPGYPDRENFGRLRMPLSNAEIALMVAGQVAALDAIARGMGLRLTHVKPHGALYNVAARDADVARAIAEGVACVDRALVLVGLCESAMLEAWRGEGFAVAAEAFADRAYEADGSLRNRALEGALLHDPLKAAAQAVSLATRQRVIAHDGTLLRMRADTLCIHGDTAGAVAIAAAVSRGLHEAGCYTAQLKTP